MTIRYESHVNGYEMGNALTDKLLALGFISDPFGQHIPGRTRYMPPHHFTFQDMTKKSALEIAFVEAVKKIREDHQFKGYIESETAVEKRFDKEDYNLDLGALSKLEFPFRPCELVVVLPEEHKAADIHIKRALDLPRDRLDELLLENNFYEVVTPRNRLFTLQTLSANDGKVAYKKLVDYFSVVHGIKQIDFEITHGFYKQPFDFPVPQLLIRGFFSESGVLDL